MKVNFNQFCLKIYGKMIETLFFFPDNTSPT